MRFAVFHSICLKYCACHALKMRPGHTKCRMNMSLALCLPNPLHLPRKNHILWSEHVVLCAFWLGNLLRATTCTFWTSQFPKVVRTCVLYILTSTCASHHHGVRFFNISTSKGGPNMCFVHFDIGKCFAPKRCALFQHPDFQRWSEHVFCTFWHRKVLRAKTACFFSTSEPPKVRRTWGAFSFLTLKSASRHKGVQFFISHLARWLRTRRFSEPTFRPSGATNQWKKQCFATFLPFRALASLFFCSFLPPCPFHLSILSEVWLLNFLGIPCELYLSPIILSPSPAVILYRCYSYQWKHIEPLHLLSLHLIPGRTAGPISCLSVNHEWPSAEHP